MPTRRQPQTRPKASTKKRNLPHLAGRLFGTPLLVDARKLDDVVPVFMRRLNGQSDDDEVMPAPTDPDEPIVDQASGVAIIPIIGSLVRRPSMMEMMSGITSYEDISCALDCALNDARVRGILLQVDTFGGEAGGCFELCQKIYDSRNVKPIWAVADIEALSAGYAILSSATRCFVAARGHVGSIGVVSVHVERSQMNEMMGLNYTVFRAGERKADFNPFEKLAPEAAAKQLDYMERTRQTFAQTVVRNRNGLLTLPQVLDTEGDFFDAEDGLSKKLVDEINTFDGVFGQLTSLVAQPTSGIAPVAPPQTPSPEDEESGGQSEPSNSPDEDTAMQTNNGTGASTGTAAQTTPPAAGATTPAPAPVVETQAPAPAPVPAATPVNVVSLDTARPDQAAREISELCTISGRPDLLAGFITEGLSVGDVRKRLLDLRANGGSAPAPATGQNAEGNGSSTELSNHIIPSTESAALLNTSRLAAPRKETMESWDSAFKRANGQLY